jgi:NADH-quinone oxidoreductase subunit L
MMIVSSIVAITGILTAWYFHYFNRDAADRAAERFPGVVRTLANKYYVDEFNDAAIVRPLRMLSDVFFLIDRMIIDGLVTGVGFLPRLFGMGVRPLQRGALQGYGLGMAFGAALVLLLVFVGMNLF